MTARLSIPQAARFLGVSPTILRRWLREGRIPCHRVTARIVIDPQELTAAMQAAPVPTDDEQAKTASLGGGRRRWRPGRAPRNLPHGGWAMRHHAKRQIRRHASRDPTGVARRVHDRPG